MAPGIPDPLTPWEAGALAGLGAGLVIGMALGYTLALVLSPSACVACFLR